MNKKIYLSPPDVGPIERQMLLDAFDSNWIAPVGPDINAFEREMCEYVGVPHAVALASGTAALHLILHALGVGPGDDVLVSTFTFAATANAITYVGARPCFIDASADTWNLCPDLLEEELDERARQGRPAKAVVVVDLLGQSADYDRIDTLCDKHGVLVVADAAESLGASYRGKKAGSFGVAAALSFNGNKIVTTSGGGMVLSHDQDLISRVHYLSTQARQPVSHYEHTEVGFNYRLSNLLAALGRGQLAGLDPKIARRREINKRYVAELGDLPGVAFAPIAPYGEPNYWLTSMTVDRQSPVDRAEIEATLNAADIETRPLWMPMHRQPVFAALPARVNGVSDALYESGLLLPSGSSLTDDEQARVIKGVRTLFS